MRVTEIRPSELGETECGLWRQFALNAPHARSAFMGWRFTACVGDVRDDARVAVIEDEGGILAFLPYHRRPMGIARPIGAPFSDQHGPVVRPGAALDLKRALKMLGLTAYMHTAMPAQCLSGPAGPVFSSAPVYAAAPGADPQAYIDRKRAEHSTRSKAFGKRERKTARERGPVEIVLDDQDPAAMEMILQLKRRQFRATGKHDVLGPGWSRAMFERLQQRDAPDFGLRVATLRLNATMAAGEICLLGQSVLHSWIAVYDPEMSNYAPGLQLLQGVIAGAPSLGVDRIDLGTGHGHYKELFADPEGTYLEGAACADGLAGGARRAATGLWRAAETAPLGPVSAFAGKLRRRSAQIASVETEFSGRARGMISALTGAAPA